MRFFVVDVFARIVFCAGELVLCAEGAANGAAISSVASVVMKRRTGRANVGEIRGMRERSLVDARRCSGIG